MIAQVHISGSFSDALDYVMNPKREGAQKISHVAEKASPPAEQEVVLSDTAAQAAASPIEDRKQNRTEKPLREAHQPSLFDDYLEPAKETRSNTGQPVAGKSVAVESMQSEKAPAYADGARHRIIGGNLGGQTAEELTKEFKAVAAQRPDIAKPVVGISLSAPVGEKISAETFREIGGEITE